MQSFCSVYAVFFFGGVGILSLNNLGDDHQLNSQYWLAQRTGTGCPIQSVGVFCDIKWCQSGESFHHCQSQHVTSCGYGSILISEHIYIYIHKYHSERGMNHDESIHSHRFFKALNCAIPRPWGAFKLLLCTWSSFLGVFSHECCPKSSWKLPWNIWNGMKKNLKIQSV